MSDNGTTLIDRAKAVLAQGYMILVLGVKYENMASWFEKNDPRLALWFVQDHRKSRVPARTRLILRTRYVDTAFLDRVRGEMPEAAHFHSGVLTPNEIEKLFEAAYTEMPEASLEVVDELPAVPVKDPTHGFSDSARLLVRFVGGLPDLKTAADSLLKEYALLLEKTRDVGVRTQELGRARAAAAELTGQNEEFRGRITNLERDLVAAREEIGILQIYKEESERMTIETTTLKSQLATAEERATRAEADVADFQSVAARFAAMAKPR